MCEMIFEVQGKTDNYVRLKRDGTGIKFLGNNYLRLVLYIDMINFHFMLTKFNYMSRLWIIIFSGGRQLVEYEIQLEALQVQSVDDISRAVCKVKI